jgi:hypothetical protein
VQNLCAIAALVNHANDAADLTLGTDQSVACALEFGWFDLHNDSFELRTIRG